MWKNLRYKFLWWGEVRDGRTLFAVDTAVDIGNKISGRGKEFELCTDADQILNRIPHIFGEILTVCPGIGTKFLFIEALHGIQCLLSRVAKIAVSVPLERSRVIEPGLDCGFSHGGR